MKEITVFTSRTGNADQRRITTLKPDLPRILEQTPSRLDRRIYCMDAIRGFQRRAMKCGDVAKNYRAYMSFLQTVQHAYHEVCSTCYHYCTQVNSDRLANQFTLRHVKLEGTYQTPSIKVEYKVK